MATKQLGVIRMGILKMKLRAPAGVKLDSGETAAIIDIWKKDQRTLTQNNNQLEEADASIKRTLDHKLPDVLAEVTQARTEAARFFKITKDPIKKREWARRLVIADHALHSVRDSKKRMTGMSDRIKTLVADASLEKQALDIRIAEAEAYLKMGKGLHLVGESLINARLRASSTSIEFTNLEFGIEAAEKLVRQTSDSNIIAQAKAIAGGK